MRRRTVLQGAAALPLLAVLPPLLAQTARPPLSRVRPGQPGWPAAADWDKLKGAVGGNLLPVQPLFAACASEPQGAACRDVMSNIRNPFYLSEQPAGTEVSGWLDAWTPAPSVYAVKARSSADVAAAVSFARQHRLRLAVKGAGHSYQGTSNAADSLLIWTHAMNRVTLHDAFVARGCEGNAQPVPAVTTEAGAMWIDLYNAVTTHAGRYVQGGGCTTVGVAGLIQSGGFGSFSKGFGTAAAGLLEAEVVTADGRVRTVNACSDPDLFWALKGGGGGSFGVVTHLTLRTHELPEFFGAAWGKVKAHSDGAFRRLARAVLRVLRDPSAQPPLGRAGAHRTGQRARALDGAAGTRRAADAAGVAAVLRLDHGITCGFQCCREARCTRYAGAALVGRRGQSLDDPG